MPMDSIATKGRTVVLPANEAAQTPGKFAAASDMERLATKADQVRKQIDELMSLRDSALDAAKREARKVVDDARHEAQDVIAKADETAKTTVARAHEAAGDMIRAVRDELAQIVETTTQRRSALDAALTALGSVPQVLPDTGDETAVVAEATVLGWAERRHDPAE